MPKFVFKALNSNETKFECKLKCQRCAAVNKDGHQCRKRVCIGTDYCWIHNKTKRSLQIKPSTIENAGKGLFAVKPNKNWPADQPLFKKGQNIVKYEGESLTNNQLQARYGDLTAPYGLKIRGNANTIDAGCKRSIASLANHKSNSQSNAKLSENGYIKAVKNILPGREIFVSYGGAYRRDSNHYTK